MSDTITAPSPAAHLEEYHYPNVYRQLLSYVENHEMRVLHEDGIYRHLRFITPGSSIGYFDLITWPGSLAIRGDIGEGFMFTREDDMFPWFSHRGAAGHINPSYWSEKLDRGTREVREQFSEVKWERYLDEMVAAFAKEHGPETADLRMELDAELSWEAIHSTDAAYQFLERFRYDGKPLVDDLSEDVGSWVDYDHHFLLACHALLWGIQKYQAAAVTASLPQVDGVPA